jgi:hypothetical protein
MCDMLVASTNDISPSILMYGWHGESDVLIGPSFWRMGDMEVACYNFINHPFWRMDGMETVMFRFFRPFWCMGGMAVACGRMV